MLLLHFEELYAQLNQKLYAIYLLLGNDPLVRQISYDTIRHRAIIQGFNEHYTFQLDNNTDWELIFSLCQPANLFVTRRTVQLLLPENGPNIIINKQLMILVNLLHKDLLLIINGNKFTKNQENVTATWLKTVSACSVQVSCLTPKATNLSRWIIAYAKNSNLEIDDIGCKLLCYYYEGNLLALSQILKKLLLLWPNTKITIQRIKQIVNDEACFTINHWLDAVLTGNIKRALRILQHLRFKDNEITIILYRLQRELILLIKLKHQLIHTKLPIITLFDKYYIWQNRRDILIKALNRLSEQHLHYVIRILVHTELSCKQGCNQFNWGKLENISFLLCHKNLLSEVFIYD